MAPQFVKPYVKTNKNDEADAEAICEAVARPSMRFVPIKMIEQQDMLSIHRVRARLVKNRTALANEIRGLLLEFGIIIPQGINKITDKLTEILDHNLMNKDLQKPRIQTQQFAKLHLHISSRCNRIPVFLF